MIPVSLDFIARALGGEAARADGEVWVKGVATDSRKLRQGELFVALRGEKFDGNDFLRELNGRAAAALCERYDKQADYPQFVVPNAKRALGRLAKYYKENAGKPVLTVAVTGSVGKTTTKEMTALALSAGHRVCKTEGNFNNDIGLPLTLLSVGAEDTALVCEMGMSFPGEIRYLAGLACPDIAMITNIGISHIENFGSREQIRNAKCEILQGLKPNGVLILNGDEPLLREIGAMQRILWVGMGAENDIRPEEVSLSADGIAFTAVVFGDRYKVFLPCVGAHNVTNALFALAAAYAARVELPSAVRALARYQPVGLRQKILRTDTGVTVIADCYNASAESMASALQVLRDLPAKGRRIAVLGDMLELGGQSEPAHLRVGEQAAGMGTDVLFLYGDRAETVAHGAAESGMNLETIKIYRDKTEMAREIKNFIRSGDIVLFKASRGMKFEEVIALAFDKERIGQL